MESTLISLLSSLPWIGGVIGFGLATLLIVVHILFAIGVLQDGETRLAAGEKVLFVKPWVWGAATLFGSIFVVVIYWAIHHCALLQTPRSTPSA